MRNIISKLAIGLFALVVLFPQPAIAASGESFTITSLMGGKNFSQGQQVTVTWTTNGTIPQVYLAVLGYKDNTSVYDDVNQAFFNLTPTPISNNGTYTWTVDVSKSDGGNAVQANYYKFVVYKAPDFSAQGISDGYFTVSGANKTTDPATPNIPDQNTGAHDPGTNILGTDGTVYHIETGGRRSPYTSAGAFLSYRFNKWSEVKKANQADMNLPLTNYTPNGASAPVTYYIPPRDGALINDHGTVYLITNGLRAGFTSSDVFLKLGYQFKNVYPGDTSFMVNEQNIGSTEQAHPSGTLVNDHGTLFVVKAGGRYTFSNMDVFNSYGYWIEEQVPANSFDRALPSQDLSTKRMVTQLNI